MINKLCPQDSGEFVGAAQAGCKTRLCLWLRDQQGAWGFKSTEGTAEKVWKSQPHRGSCPPRPLKELCGRGQGCPVVSRGTAD